MKVQHHINAPVAGTWYRCIRVGFVGETANWELDRNGQYGFLEAYERTPHRQLIQASDDAALRAFVKAWGPLRFQLDAWSGSDSIEWYRRERDRLTATVRVLASVEEGEMQRSALIGFSELSRTDESLQLALWSLRTNFQIPGTQIQGFDENIRQWFELATPEQIEAATIALVQMLGPSPLSCPQFRVERERRHNVLRATLNLTSLSDALSWMVWQDVFQSHPYQFCAECRKLFQPDTRHEKKFCSQECAHRKTAREWQQRKRNKERRTNGTKKTR
jgi:hypothetical protein